jgi:hypothetical protein
MTTDWTEDVPQTEGQYPIRYKYRGQGPVEALCRVIRLKSGTALVLADRKHLFTYRPGNPYPRGAHTPGSRILFGPKILSEE